MLDIIIISICFLFFFRGYSKGVIAAILSLVAALIAWVAALKLSDNIAQKLFNNQAIVSAKWAPLLTHILVFAAVILLFRMASRASEKALKEISLGWVNKLAGGTLYLCFAAFLFSIVLGFFSKMNFLNPDIKNASVVYPHIEPIAPKIVKLVGIAMPFVKNSYQQLDELFDKINHSLNPDVDTHR